MSYDYPRLDEIHKDIPTFSIHLNTKKIPSEYKMSVETMKFNHHSAKLCEYFFSPWFNASYGKVRPLKIYQDMPAIATMHKFRFELLRRENKLNSFDL